MLSSALDVDVMESVDHVVINPPPLSHKNYRLESIHVVFMDSIDLLPICPPLSTPHVVASDSKHVVTSDGVARSVLWCIPALRLCGLQPTPGSKAQSNGRARFVASACDATFSEHTGFAGCELSSSAV